MVLLASESEPIVAPTATTPSTTPGLPHLSVTDIDVTRKANGPAADKSPVERFTTVIDKIPNVSDGQATIIAQTLINSFESAGGRTFYMNPPPNQRAMITQTLLQHFPGQDISSMVVSVGMGLEKEMTALREEETQRRNVPTSENIESWRGSVRNLNDRTLKFAKESAIALFEIERAVAAEDVRKEATLREGLKGLQTKWKGDLETFTHLDSRPGFEGARAEAAKNAEKYQAEALNSLREEYLREKEIRALKESTVTYARELSYAVHFGDQTRADRARERYEASVARSDNLTQGNESLQRELRELVHTTTIEAARDIERAQGSMVAIDATFVKKPQDVEGILLILRRSSQGERQLLDEYFRARPDHTSLRDALRNSLPESAHHRLDLAISGGNAWFDAETISSFVKRSGGDLKPNEAREQIRLYAASLPPEDLMAALKRMNEKTSPSASTSMDNLKNCLGRDMSRWLDALSQGDIVSADAIRIHQALCGENASSRDVMKSLIEMDPAQRNKVIVAYSTEYRVSSGDLESELRQRTSNVADRQVLSALFSGTPQELHKRLSLRALGLLNNEFAEGTQGFVQTGSSLVSGSVINLTHTDLREFNRLVQTLTIDQRTQLLHDIEKSLPPGTTIDSFNQPSGMPAGRVIRELLAHGSVAEEALSSYMHYFETRDPRTTIAREMQARFVNEKLRDANLYIGSAEKNEAMSRQAREELRNGGLTHFFAWTSGTLDAAQTTVNADALRVEQTRGKLKELSASLGRSESLLGEFRESEQQGRFEALFARNAQQAQQAQDTLNRAQIRFNSAMDEITRVSAFSDPSAYMKGLSQANNEFDAAINWLDKTERTLRTTRTVLVVAGATLATGGVASAPALAGFGTFVTGSVAVGAGTLTGGVISGLSNTGEAIGDIATGNKTTRQAFSAAGKRTLEDTKQSAYASVATVLGLGVFKTLVPNPQAASNLQRIVGGMRAGGAGATANQVLQLPEKFVTASLDFERQFGHLPKDQKNDLFPGFMKTRRLDPVAIVQDALFAYGTGAVSGGIGGKADIAASSSSGAHRIMLVRTAEAGTLTTIGITASVTRNAINGKTGEQLLTAEDVARDITGILVKGGTNQAQSFGAKRLVLKPERGDPMTIQNPNAERGASPGDPISLPDSERQKNQKPQH